MQIGSLMNCPMSLRIMKSVPQKPASVPTGIMFFLQPAGWARGGQSNCSAPPALLEKKDFFSQWCSVVFPNRVFKPEPNPGGGSSSHVRNCWLISKSVFITSLILQFSICYYINPFLPWAWPAFPCCCCKMPRSKVQSIPGFLGEIHWWV